jgi:protein SCO1
MRLTTSTRPRLPARLDPDPPTWADRVVALAIALGLALALGGCSGGSPAPAHEVSRESAPATSEFRGAALPGNVIAPGFTLTDQYGRAVSLSEYRGRVVILTFLYSRCGATCILIAQQIRGAIEELAKPAVVLIVSADLQADTPRSVTRFLQEVSLEGRVEYLTGPPARLRKVWRAYGVTPASSNPARFERFASLLLIDAGGRERVLFEPEVLTPEALSHDVGKLQEG